MKIKWTRVKYEASDKHYGVPFVIFFSNLNTRKHESMKKKRKRENTKTKKCTKTKTWNYEDENENAKTRRRKKYEGENMKLRRRKRENTKKKKYEDENTKLRRWKHDDENTIIIASLPVCKRYTKTCSIYISINYPFSKINSTLALIEIINPDLFPTM